MQASRRAVDNAGDRLRKGTEKPGDEELLQAYRSFRGEKLQQFYESILPFTAGKGTVIAGRLKRVPTMVRKLGRSRHLNVTRLDDIVGFRIVVPSIEIQRQLATEMSQKTLGKSLRKTNNYQENPRASGYRGIHLIYGMEQTHRSDTQDDIGTYEYKIEVQVRTYYQHLWATISEGFGENVKEGKGNKSVRNFLDYIGTIISEKEEKYPHKLQFVEEDTADPAKPYLLHFKKDKVQSNYAMLAHGTRQFRSRGGDLVFINAYPSVYEAARAQSSLESKHLWTDSREIVFLYAPGLDYHRTHLRYFTHLEKTGFLEKDEILECKRRYPNVSF